MIPDLRKEKEKAQIDASRYISEMKREALTTLVPHPDEIEKRIELIAITRGRRPDMYRLHLANVEQEGWIALEEGRNPDLKSMDAIRFIHTNSTGLGGKRSEQVVEIAKTEGTVPVHSVLDVLRRKK